MASNAALHPLKTQAARIARALRGGAALAGAWVSTEAAVRTDNGTVLRPAVVVATCDPPYDGILSDGVLLVVELHSEHVQRWSGAAVGAVWAPWGAGAVAISGTSARIVPAGGTLMAEQHPELTAPVELLRPPGEEGSRAG